MNGTAVQLVCFDLGRVLIRLAPSWGEACRRAGVAVPGVAGKEPGRAAIEWIARHEVGGCDADALARAMGEAFGMDPAAALAAFEAYLGEPYEGVDELIEELGATGLTTACLSNTNDLHWAMMTAGNGRCRLPLDRLTHRFASHLMRCRKPESEAYAHVERVVGVAGPGIVFFDDKAENVTAARQRGWCGHVVRDRDDPVNEVRGVLAEMGVIAPSA